MRFPVGAFVFLNSGSPLLQVMCEPYDHGNIVIAWLNPEKADGEDRAVSNEACFRLAPAEPFTTIG